MNISNLLKGEISQKDLLNYYNATIIYEELPENIQGLVFNYDSIFFILIDKNLSYYKKRKTILHELAHIELSQFNQINKDLFAFHTKGYEDEADKYIKIILDNLV
jgi:hypothetical protein